MASTRSRLERLTAALAAVPLAAGLLVAVTPPVAAAPAPVVPKPAAAVTADALPTVQVDGVVWSQVVVGNVVYAGGSFASARPAGAAAGTNLVARTNLLAYDITTGQLVTTFAPTTDGQVLSVAAAPDGTRIYVAGDFTTVNGQVRRKVAALDPVTGAVVGAFKPVGVGGQARAVVATSTTVYVGGGFGTLGNGLVRNNLTAFRASDGVALPWNPSADYTVWGVAASTDGRWLFAGGSFQNVGGQAAYGLAKIDASSGALDTTWKPVVRNAGPDTGISSLKVQGAYVYGTAWAFGSGGNLEGAFKIPVANSTAEWVTACHGDYYSVFMTNGVVYTTGHAHYCGTMGGGFPQYPSWRYQHARAWTDAPAGEILTDQLNRANWHGVASAPSMVGWLPTMGVGSYTGQFQAGWAITGNSDYVVYGGEFPTVNGVGQQGLVRFARRAIAPRKRGPIFPGGPFTPRLVPTSDSTLRVSWISGYDRDDYTLTYRVVRDGNVVTPRYTTQVSASWWSLPSVGFVDTGLVPGATYRYQLVATDPDGNTVSSAVAAVTMPTSSPPVSAYAQSVRANGATTYWPLDEVSGPTVSDRAAGTAASSNVGTNDAVAGSGVVWGQPGAITGYPAVTLADNIASRTYANASETGRDTFTIQVWERTTTTRGGRILGFGDLQVGDSAHRDRQLWMDNAGHVLFGVRAPNGSTRTVASSASYNDNRWHMLTATMGPGGMSLYVDGVLVGQRSDTTQGEAYLGYWRLGGDVLDGWPSTPTTRNFTGGVDEVALYPVALSQAQVQAQYALRGGGAGNQSPTPSFISSVTGLTASFDASGSRDQDGSIVGWAWSFGDGTTATGVRPSRTYAAGGTYTVTLTVTDNAGATASSSSQVSVAAPGVIANDDFERTLVDGWGSAATGGAWTTTTAASNFAVSGGAGRMQVVAGSAPSAYLPAVSALDVDLRTTFSYDKAGTGGGVYTNVVGRRSGTSDYRLKVRATATDTTAYLVRTVSGTETTLATASLPGVVVAAGDSMALRLVASGTNPTTLRGKLWRSTAVEPVGWTVTTSDTTAALQAAGAVGVSGYLSASATSSPVTLGLPSFVAMVP